MKSLIQQDLLESNYQYILFSTTAKHNTELLRLPNRIINGKKSANLLVTNEEIAQCLFELIDGVIPKVLVDVEQKQSINLFALARKTLNKSQVLSYKPNDITVEATDQLMLNHFSNDLTNKNILIYGTGNISTKLAIRFAERQAKVFIQGRDLKKVMQIVNAVNLILPTYTKHTVSCFDSNASYDAILSFVSAEKVIDHSLAKLLNNFSIAIDGGIGNFTESFIAETRRRSIRMLRLDVRIGEPFIEASVMAHNQAFFYEVMGEKTIGGIQIVAGGIIGSEGAVIVDQIKKPTQIIGIANGFGGVKSETDLTDGEKRSLATVKQFILQTK